MALRRGRDSGNDPNALSGVGDRVTVETTKRPLQYQRLCTRVDLMTTDCYRCSPADLSRVSRGSNRYDSGVRPNDDLQPRRPSLQSRD